MQRSRFFAVVVVSLTACQTYEFNRVEPFTVSQHTEIIIFASHRLKPNVMLLVDNSGSMLFPTDPTNPACPANCGNSQNNRCPATCPTRVSEMRAAMDSFLTNRGTVARFGLTVFPQADADQCRPPVIVNESIPGATLNDEGTDQALISNAGRVNTTLRAITNNPIGGTPTGAALEFVGTNPSLLDLEDQRDDLVILLTDGVPNCNAQNPAAICDCVGAGCPAARTNACACTLGACDLGANRCAIGCLDSDNAVAQVKSLFQRNIRTAVVGFGADVVSGPGPAVLQAMANEGGFARTCPNGTTAECGGGACDTTTHQCAQSFYAARNATELEEALAKISEPVVDICQFRLKERPSQPGYLAVLIDGQNVSPSDATWHYDEPQNAVLFTGALCTRLTNSTPREPVNVQFRVVQTL
ncbi:MAG: adventurous gliding motility lipoprotein CglB [Archangium sp.]